MTYEIDTFLNDYRSLEEWAMINYSLSRMEELEQMDFNNKTIRELRYFRSVRNITTHNPNDSTRPLIQLTDEFATQFKSLCSRLMKPQVAMDYAISGSKIYKSELSDFVVPTISHMHEKVYTHVPIMMNNKVWGVFSENTLFELASENKLETVDSSLQFYNLDCCKIRNTSDSVYSFIPKDMTIDDVVRIFQEAVNSTKRLDILFITDTGTSDGKLLGLITAWDVAAL